MLMLSALANDREVLVSRGELVEIGGGFRVPDVMQAAGAKLKEVGTTNKTHLRDFEAALTEDVAGILRVHHSNFKQIGFVHQPSLAELASLPTRLLVDLGSGQLDFNGAEPSVEEAMAAGAHVVCMSGDKLLGGPQAGIVIGQPEEIGCLRRHPIYRALRPDKTILAALEGTLDDWLTGRGTAVDHMRSLSVETMQAVVERWCSALNHRADLSVAQTRATVGVVHCPARISLQSRSRSLMSGRRNYKHLLNGYPPVVCRRRDSQLFIDARSIIVLEQEALLLEALEQRSQHFDNEFSATRGPVSDRRFVRLTPPPHQYERLRTPPYSIHRAKHDCDCAQRRSRGPGGLWVGQQALDAFIVTDQ